MPETAADQVSPAPIGDPVRVWACDLDASGAASESHRKLLSADERKRASRFHHETGRRRFVAGRAALRLILAEVLEAEPDQLELATTQAGRPFLARPRHADIDFNVSHAGPTALIALAVGRRVGVDIERVRSLSDAESLVERFFADEERTQFRALPDESRVRAFFATWTRKEAFAKATGRGIADTLHRFVVTVDPDRPPSLLRVDWADDEPEDWELVDLPAPGDYMSALAVKGSGWHLDRRVWTT